MTAAETVALGLKLRAVRRLLRSLEFMFTPGSAASLLLAFTFHRVSSDTLIHLKDDKRGNFRHCHAVLE